MRKANSDKIIKLIGFDLKIGDKIRLIDMPGDPFPIPFGSVGVVTEIVDWGTNEIQVQVDWRIKRSLNLICPPDKIEKV